MNTPSRIERDTLGEVLVPAEALYGAQTQRAVENFPISQLRFTRPFIRALGLIKAAAARVNGELGVLPRDLAAAIETAAQQVAKGDYDAQFVVDIFQTGSGTSTNMNANEVIARLAGAHPNDHVNLSQSSNDVIPTVIHVAAAELVHHELLPAMTLLHSTLREKAEEFDDVLKIGRTHLQDAVPIRLGQEFNGYARQVELSIDRVRLNEDLQLHPKHVLGHARNEIGDQESPADLDLDRKRLVKYGAHGLGPQSFPDGGGEGPPPSPDGQLSIHPSGAHLSSRHCYDSSGMLGRPLVLAECFE
jgi:aspartate ammonia-lyase